VSIGTRTAVTASVCRHELVSACVRFSGDAGDGMHLAGDQLTRTATEQGSAVFTLPDYPAEIRSPAGSLAGVTGFQVQFGARAETPGDRVQALVAMNPAALRANLPDVEPGGIIIVNAEAFATSEFVKAGYDRDPLTDGTLAGFHVVAAPIYTLTRDAVAGMKLSPREADRCRSFVALGIVYWLFERPLDPTLEWLDERFPTQPDVYKAGKRTLQAGYHFGESVRLEKGPYKITPSVYPPGVYRRVTGIKEPGEYCAKAIASEQLGADRIVARLPDAALYLLDPPHN
jgi:2-oxoglutarate ferredoxin oxidoreductase subunit alpha